MKAICLVFADECRPDVRETGVDTLSTYLSDTDILPEIIAPCYAFLLTQIPPDARILPIEKTLAVLSKIVPLYACYSFVEDEIEQVVDVLLTGVPNIHPDDPAMPLFVRLLTTIAISFPVSARQLLEPIDLLQNFVFVATASRTLHTRITILELLEAVFSPPFQCSEAPDAYAALFPVLATIDETHPRYYALFLRAAAVFMASGESPAVRALAAIKFYPDAPDASVPFGLLSWFRIGHEFAREVSYPREQLPWREWWFWTLVAEDNRIKAQACRVFVAFVLTITDEQLMIDELTLDMAVFEVIRDVIPGALFELKGALVCLLLWLESVVEQETLTGFLLSYRPAYELLIEGASTIQPWSSDARGLLLRQLERLSDPTRSELITEILASCGDGELDKAGGVFAQTIADLIQELA
jgi:hypothetical protein